MKVVICSGFMNPITGGHIDYLTEAALLGDYMVVIVNNDNQVKIKGAVPFMDEAQRCKIVQAIKGVDLAVISKDEDGTVIKSIELIHTECQKEPGVTEIVFAKGGDRTLENIPEADICNKLGIKMVFGVGGGKTESSSSLIADAIKKVVQPSVN
jgi:cytidyltransferase-like protein